MSDNQQSMDTLRTGKPHLLRGLEQEVHVWLTRPEDVTDTEKLQACQALLSAGENERYRRFRFDKDRHNFLVSHALVRKVLSAYVDVDPSSWQFTSGQYGRPEIAGPDITSPLRFNLTHTAGLVACIVALDADCGIDVEQLSARGNLSGIAGKMFAASEQQTLKGLQGQDFLEQFFCFWTLHEAYCKALGTGIAHSKRNYCFNEQDAGQWTIRLDAPASGERDHWQFAVIKPTRQHVAALAVRTAGATHKSIVQQFVVP